MVCRADEKHPEHKEAGLRMIGSVGHIITKKGSPILGMMESFLVSHVFPEFSSPHGYMRARACEVLNRFSDIDFEDHNVLPPSPCHRYEDVIVDRYYIVPICHGMSR